MKHGIPFYLACNKGNIFLNLSLDHSSTPSDKTSDTQISCTFSMILFAITHDYSENVISKATYKTVKKHSQCQTDIRDSYFLFAVLVISLV